MKIKKTLHFVWLTLRGLIFACVAAILLANLYLTAAKSFFGQKNPTVFGFSTAVILTGSMSGTIESNDLIVTLRQDEYAVGDIIMFDTDTSSVTHRIIAEEEEGYRTKGDANNTQDESPVKKESVVGKVVLVIPKIGAFVLFIRTPLGMLCFLALSALLLELPSLVKYFMERKGT